MSSLLSITWHKRILRVGCWQSMLWRSGSLQKKKSKKGGSPLLLGPVKLSCVPPSRGFTDLRLTSDFISYFAWKESSVYLRIYSIYLGLWNEAKACHRSTLCSHLGAPAISRGRGFGIHGCDLRPALPVVCCWGQSWAAATYVRLTLASSTPLSWLHNFTFLLGPCGPRVCASAG